MKKTNEFLSKINEFSDVGGMSITPLTLSKENKVSQFSIEKNEILVDNLAKQDINVCIDYFNFNLPLDFNKDKDKINDLLKVLKLCSYEYEEIISKSKSGTIRTTYKYSTSTAIYFNDSKSNDKDLTRVELKGEGCREFERRDGSWYELSYFVLVNGGWLTRLDLAIDDFRGQIKTKELDYKIQNCEYVSKFKVVNPDGTKNCVDYSDNGWGYLFGGNYSAIKLRLYDKLAERQSKGIAVDCNDWIRYEIRFMYDMAKSVLIPLIENLANINVFAKGILKELIEFKKPSMTDGYKYRWNIWEKWDKFLESVEKVKVVNQFKYETSLEKSRNWFTRSATKIMMANKLSMDKEEYHYYQLKNELTGLEKITPAVLYTLNEERIKNHLPKISMEDIRGRIIDLKNEMSEVDLNLDEIRARKYAKWLLADNYKELEVKI